MFGITIDGVHTSTLGLRMTDITIPQPEPKTNMISIPGASAGVDLTEVTGQINYENREGITFAFVLRNGFEEWDAVVTKIAMMVHGKRCKVIVDHDLGHYYSCRLTVDFQKTKKAVGTITISGTADPFKYDVQASDEEWKWDTFNFEYGAIRNLKNLSISNGDTVTIHGAGKAQVPEFIVAKTNNLTVVHNNRAYNMYVAGTYRFPSIQVADTDVALKFTGSGTLTIRYRGAYL